MWWLQQERHCLIVEADAAAAPDAGDAVEFLSSWLKGLPCPVVALASERSSQSLNVNCDTIAAHPDEAAAIARNCARYPLAALALVHVLRVTESLPCAQGLLVESLAYATLQAGPEFARWRDTYSGVPALQDEDLAVRIERNGDHVSIHLNRPQAHNALNVALRDALVEAFDLVSADPSVATATVSGAGRCFSVGGDLGEFGERPDPASAHRIRSLRSPALSLLRCRQRVDFQVHGACLGSGIELPALGRRIQAKRNAYFQLPELRLGLIPGSGGCISLPMRIGRQRTAWLALTGKRLNAREALAWGLVDSISD